MAPDGLNPTGPAQPELDQVYETTGNPISKEPAQQVQAQRHARDGAPPTDTRIPQRQASYSEATPTSVARGVRGAPPGEEAHGQDHADVGRSNELEAEQMAAPGEGKIADAVAGRLPGASGGGGKEPGMETDLERKKAEQAPMRDAIKEQKAANFDVGGVLGQRGGPANPVDKDNYPNSDKH